MYYNNIKQYVNILFCMDYLDEASSQVIKFHRKIFNLFLILSFPPYNPLISKQSYTMLSYLAQSTLFSLFFSILFFLQLILMLHLISNLFTP